MLEDAEGFIVDSTWLDISSMVLAAKTVKFIDLIKWIIGNENTNTDLWQAHVNCRVGNEMINDLQNVFQNLPQKNNSYINFLPIGLCSESG